MHEAHKISLANKVRHFRDVVIGRVVVTKNITITHSLTPDSYTRTPYRKIGPFITPLLDYDKTTSGSFAADELIAEAEILLAGNAGFGSMLGEDADRFRELGRD